MERSFIICSWDVEDFALIARVAGVELQNKLDTWTIHLLLHYMRAQKIWKTCERSHNHENSHKKEDKWGLNIYTNEHTSSQRDRELKIDGRVRLHRQGLARGRVEPGGGFIEAELEPGDGFT